MIAQPIRTVTQTIENDLRALRRERNRLKHDVQKNARLDKMVPRHFYRPGARLGRRPSP